MLEVCTVAEGRVGEVGFWGVGRMLERWVGSQNVFLFFFFFPKAEVSSVQLNSLDYIIKLHQIRSNNPFPQNSETPSE